MSNASIDVQRTTKRERDQLPRFGIGHVTVTAADINQLADFYEQIGMRLVINMGRMAILELRGGTHVVLGPGNAGAATLDLIVDNIDDTRAILESAGADPSPIQRGNPHDRFLATDPEGNTLVVNSNHAVGRV